MYMFKAVIELLKVREYKKHNEGTDLYCFYLECLGCIMEGLTARISGNKDSYKKVR